MAAPNTPVGVRVQHAVAQAFPSSGHEAPGPVQRVVLVATADALATTYGIAWWDRHCTRCNQRRCASPRARAHPPSVAGVHLRWGARGATWRVPVASCAVASRRGATGLEFTIFLGSQFLHALGALGLGCWRVDRRLWRWRLRRWCLRHRVGIWRPSTKRFSHRLLRRRCDWQIRS